MITKEQYDAINSIMESNNTRAQELNHIGAAFGLGVVAVVEACGETGLAPYNILEVANTNSYAEYCSKSIERERN